MENNALQIAAFDPRPQEDDENYNEEELQMLQQMHEIQSPGTYRSKAHMQVGLKKATAEACTKASGAQAGAGKAYGRALQNSRRAEAYVNQEIEKFNTITRNSKGYKNADVNNKAGMAFEKHHEVSLKTNELLAGKEPSPQLAQKGAKSDLTYKAPDGSEGAHQLKCRNLEGATKALEKGNYGDMKKVVPKNQVEPLTEGGQKHVCSEVEGNHGIKSDPIQKVEDMRAAVENENELQISKKKVDSQKPSKGLAVIVSVAAAALFTILESSVELIPKYRDGEITLFYLLKELGVRVVTTVATAGGIGFTLAILEELCPKFAAAAGPLLMVAALLVVAVPAVKQWWKNEITFCEMSTTILRACAANGFAYGGAVLGAGLASAAGPIGTIIGGCIGGWLGAHLGSWLIDIGSSFFGWLFGNRPCELLIKSLTIVHEDGTKVPLDPDVEKDIVNAVEGGCFGFGKTGPTALNTQLPRLEKGLDKHMRKFALRWHPDKNRGREEEAQAKFIAACQNVERLKYMLHERIGFEHRRVLGVNAGQQRQIVNLQAENANQAARIAELEARLAAQGA